MSNENINDNNKQTVYLLYETSSAKRDYNDEIVGVFSTNDKAEKYKQKLEKHLDYAFNYVVNFVSYD